MKKELFVSTMEKIEGLVRLQDEFNNILHKIDDQFGGGYIFTQSIDILEHLLKELVNDEYDYISYFMWELDFGKDYTDGTITEADGTIIKLENASDLYNLIQSSK